MISRRSRCALHAVGYLAYRARDSEQPVSLGEIREYLRTYSRRLTFSAGHVSKIFQVLCRAGVLRAVPGRNGGYLLARDPARIHLSEVITALDGPPESECCLLSIGPCDNQTQCGVFGVINRAERSFYEFLDRETADSLARKMFAVAPPAPLRGSSGPGGR